MITISYAMITEIHVERHMTLFDVTGTFDLKIKLYKLDDKVIRIWKYRDCICAIIKNRIIEVENCYVTHPKINHEYDELLNEWYMHRNKKCNNGTWHTELVCHGGITYSGELVIGDIFDNNYWLGFDYAHSSDWLNINPFGEYTDIETKIVECESLAQQIINYLENVS